jgi:hypothetical protein
VAPCKQEKWPLEELESGKYAESRVIWAGGGPPERGSFGNEALAEAVTLNGSQGLLLGIVCLLG